MEIIKKYNGSTDQDITGSSVFTSIGWDDLLPAIKQIIRFREDEIIDGFLISDEGIKIKLSRKKGRKIKK